MARDVKSKLNFYGGGDIDRAVDVAELVLQDPIMVLAVDRHMEKQQQTDTDIVECIAQLLKSLKGEGHRGPLTAQKEEVRALIARAR